MILYFGNMAVKKMLAIAENISQTWVLADYDEKQKLQYLIFPEGILYNKEKDRVRTKRVNSLFAEISLLTRDVEEKKKGNSKKNCPTPYSVPHIGELSNQYKADLELLYKLKPILRMVKPKFI